MLTPRCLNMLDVVAFSFLLLIPTTLSCVSNIKGDRKLQNVQKIVREIYSESQMELGNRLRAYAGTQC
jgi:hypothetical protein